MTPPDVDRWASTGPGGAVTIHRLSPGSVNPLRHALYEAAFWRGGSRPGLEAALATSHLAVYLNEWGRPGDAAVVACDPSGAIGGAAWFRLFTDNAHGYGFVDRTVPEVSIGVHEDWRGLGIGTRLLQELHAEARRSAILQLSLSVERDNPAHRFYERFGYREQTRTGGAVTMVITLEP